MAVTLEQKLSEIFHDLNILYAVERIDKVIIGRLDDSLIVKLRLVDPFSSSRYDSIEISVISRVVGVIDKQIFKFVELCGCAEHPFNPNMAPVEPYMTYNNNADIGVNWYGAVTKEHEERIRSAVLRYIGTFYAPA